MEEFEAFYRRTLPLVYRYAAARVGPSAAEEITSEVFHAAAVAVRSGAVDELSIGWLIGVAKHKVVDHWRREERRGKVERLAEPDAADLVEPSAETRAASGWSDATEVLERLPTRYRTLLTLRYIDDLPVTELARLSGRSEAAIASALSRARRAFRATFDEVIV